MFLTWSGGHWEIQVALVRLVFFVNFSTSSATTICMRFVYYPPCSLMSLPLYPHWISGQGESVMTSAAVGTQTAGHVGHCVGWCGCIKSLLHRVIGAGSLHQTWSASWSLLLQLWPVLPCGLSALAALWTIWFRGDISANAAPLLG